MNIYITAIHGLSYIRTSELEESLRMELEFWMYGQTRPYIDELDNNQDAVYLWDYENFLEFKKGNPFYFD